MARIVVAPPEGERVKYELGRVVTIGRTPANHIRILDGAASRKHCMIKAIGETFTLVDLGSANGTVVNGDRVKKEVVLSDGDMIKIGKTVLTFKED